MRRMLTVADRMEIATGIKAGWTIRRIAGHIDRALSVISREVRRNSLKFGVYKVAAAYCRAERARRPPQPFKLGSDARVV